ncbi:short-chain dehydrogenase/reductase SDR [Reticulomyxa filosa]|uniref:Short-chain dehydrogenase/reductase SDR n=1 Tax=Reticulomyxa filosa TaxID=46433 RepID=X6MIM1_RETFI|nr:short-chain dehydrogenase/reductase SDR [Reticulomyxa filosa]|eukprot:ETO13853.1 short-chain dehydrogenase/reductase SDR [Reticulomyxa filosa]
MLKRRLERIGEGIAKKFAEHGAKLALIDIASFENVWKEIKSIKRYKNENKKLEEDIICLKCDISNETQVKKAITEILKKFKNKKIDVLVNNAARFVFNNIIEATNEDWDNSINVNIKGHIYMIKHTSPHMDHSGKGSIINMASVSSVIAQPNFITYSLCKTALLSLTRNNALDLWNKYKIRVNAICPGTIFTPALANDMKLNQMNESQYADFKLKEQIIKRFGTTEDIAFAVLFFASDESTFCNGSFLFVDGGHTAL